MKDDMSLGERLASIVGSSNVLIEDVVKERYSRDALGPHRGYWQDWAKITKPEAVVRPKTTSQVSAVVRLCAAEHRAIIPWGGGSGLMGGAVPIERGIVVDLRGMNQILAVKEDDRMAVVEAGVVLKDLEAQLNKKGLMLGHDPWSLPVATVGGAIATNGLGYLGARYGSMGEQVLGLVAVLPNGQIITIRAVPKTSTGPNLKELFVGSEGCFGIVTEATLKVFPIPEERLFCAVEFNSFEQGFKAIQSLYVLGLKPALLDFGERDVSFLPPEVRALLHFEQTAPTLYIAFEGIQGEVDIQKNRANEICFRYEGRELSDQKAQEFWETRHEAGDRYLEARERGEVSAWPNLPPHIKLDFVHVSISPSEVLGYRRACQEITTKHGVNIWEFGLWNRPELFSVVMFAQGGTEEEALAKMTQAVDEVLTKAQALGGSMEYCHGIGLRLAHLMERELGEGLDVLKKIKRALDPEDIMNPGKMGL
ncbi:MAG: FAD-binding oxidoreductase [Chloroflexi bacterium]|nr:FAD-binding oxidoreductase [Chloroflexota bacterium]